MIALEIQILLMALLLAVSAFLSGAETALFSLSTYERKRLQKETDATSLLALRLLEHPKRLTRQLLFGNTLVQVLFVSTASIACFRELGHWSGAALGVLAAAVLLLLAGEVTPKMFAATSPLSIVRRTVRPLHVICSILRPPAMLLANLAGWTATKLAPPRPDHPTEPMTDPGAIYEDMVHTNRETRPVPSLKGSALIEYLGRFEETRVREVMTPRIEMVCGDLSCSHDEAQQLARQARRSRIPFYRDDLDGIEGILSVKPFLLSGKEALEPFLDPPYFIPEGKRIRDLLQDFQTRNLAIAIVLDEHGQTTGLVTREDILEEIFGEVYDEDEVEEELEITPLAEGGWQVLGKARVGDVERTTGLSFEADEGIDRLAGVVMHYLGEIPEKGDSFILENHQISISKVTRHRVQEVLIRPLTALRDHKKRGSASQIKQEIPAGTPGAGGEDKL